jgi:pimeloyl-ACP methyl ester carboxylesterase/predicted glycosyltransferase
MRAREPDVTGVAESNGVHLGYEVFGDGGPTLLLLPTWTIVHARFWKAQVPYLARHYRVITYDGPGNGRSDRTLDPAAYTVQAQADAALAVLDAVGAERAVLVSLSNGAKSALWLAAHCPERVLGSIFIGPNIGLGQTDPARAASMQNFNERYTSTEGWAKYNRYYWLDHYEDFAWFFFGKCFTEPHSTKQIEDCVGWALETTPEVLLANYAAGAPDLDTYRAWCAKVRCRTLVIHGEADAIVSISHGSAFANALGGPLVTMQGSGHIPLARDPVQINLLVREFVDTLAPPPPRSRVWSRALPKRKRALYISSPIGLGHAQRDAAIARELRALHPDLEIDWLAQHPVTKLLEANGERIHPASAHLANESRHIECESAEHDLHAFQAIRRMDEILTANFMVFHDVVREGEYDLWIGDEAWDIDYYLHENPAEKRAGYVWLTDFVGWLPFTDGGARESFLTADYNAEMIEQIARYPRVRDRALFVGNPDDVVSDRFGPNLPPIRDWTEEHYAFTGYISGFDPAQLPAREALRHELGYAPDEKVCIVTVGGSGVGAHLLRRITNAFDESKRRVPELRMIVVAGPRIDPASLPTRDGLEVRAYVHNLYRNLAACDLAIVQGGLTTAMELTANRRPFLYFPLRHHFEQNFHVHHRLSRYGAGRRMDYDTATPDVIADAIVHELGRAVEYRAVENDGARRAAEIIAQLL